MDEQNLRRRCEVLIISMVGKDMSLAWWTNSNKAFSGDTPLEAFDKNPREVYNYLMGSACGGW